MSTARALAAHETERFLWQGPESKVDAAIRRHSPLPVGCWFRSYVHPELTGWVQLYRVRK